jgi:hypothetical protein
MPELNSADCLGELPMRIDWSRAAEPQPDGYDTSLALHLVNSTTGPERPELYQRRPSAGSPTIFDDTVAVRYITQQPEGAPRFVNAPLEHPNIAIGCDYVRRWPLAFLQFQRLMDSFHPMLDATLSAGQFVLGSGSHSLEGMFGAMYATVYDPHGLAQAFVHEMSHNKLRAIGIFVESAQRLIANAPNERFESPIRKDVLRPMTAVFHAQYSFMYVTALDVEMIESESQEEELRRWVSLLSRNVPRMEEGDRVLRQFLHMDRDGEAFFAGFFGWSDRVLRRGNEQLREYRSLLSKSVG